MKSLPAISSATVGLLAAVLLNTDQVAAVPTPSSNIPSVGAYQHQHHAKSLAGSLRTDANGSAGLDSVLALRGGSTGDEFVGAAYDWCINLGAPAALVAGAVVATLYENVRGGELEVKKSDSNYVRFAKKMTTILLVTAFGMQIVSIFVTTVTGTMLLSRGPLETKANSPLEYLREHFEFEYLTSRLSFLQGLLNWLAAVAVEHTIPRKGEGKAAVKMNQFLASSLTTLIVVLVSFYNAHMTFYDNYFEMVTRWFQVTSKRFLLQWPPRPLALIFAPSIVFSAFLFVQALRNEERDEDYTES